MKNLVDYILELIAWLHVLGAILWFGGILTLEFVITPSFKKSDAPNKADILFHMGKQVGMAVTVSASLVLVTGVLRVWYVIGFDFGLLLDTFWGNVLILKILLFFIFGALGGSMGKTLGTLTPQSSNEEVKIAFEKIKKTQILDVIVGVLIILLAVTLRYNPI